MAINNLIVRRCVVTIVALVSFATGFNSQADDLRVSEVKRLANGQTQVTATGSATSPVALEASSNFADWSNVTTFPANSSTMSYTDETVGAKVRFYRLRNTGVSPTPVTLTDLATMPNRVFAAPEGATTIQYAANGNLAFIAWRDRDLIIRERNTSGSWTEAVVNSLGKTFTPLTTFDFSGPRNDYAFQPSAALAYDSQSRPHVFFAAGTTIIHYTRNGSTWSEAERIADSQANANIVVLHAIAGSNDIFHFIALSSGSPRNLTYGSNRNGSWEWTTISTVEDAPLTYWAPPFAPRWLGLAVDSRNNAHVVYRPSMTMTYHPDGYPRAYSELWYASNVSGGWRTQLVQAPFDPSGEAANGAGIAVGPDDKPRIVSWYDERADTGSAQESRLYLHQQDGNGNWSASIVAQSPDGYIAGDGPKGTGFSPLLKFDNRGRAHILFMDAAGEHFGWPIGQQEYAGNVRHAWWNGNGWSVETVYQQTKPLEEQGVYPTFALSGNELAMTFVDRKTQWNFSAQPPLLANSTYYFRFVTKPLQ